MSAADAQSPLLTLDQVAQRLSLSRRTVERLVAAELLPALRVSARAIRIDAGELESWLYQDAGQPAGGSSAGPQTPAARAGEPLARADEPRRGARGDDE
jgi:excisionase family DNA binding protein